jgi:phage tail-like protein
MSTPIYPIAKFHFSVKWGVERVGFTEVTGLDVQVELIEYREGNSPVFSKVKQPGMLKYSNITLKRGTMAADSDFFKWINEMDPYTHESKRREITISLLNEGHTPIMTWTAKNAFPVKYQASDLKADGNEVAIETLEIAHEGLTVLAQ